MVSLNIDGTDSGRVSYPCDVYDSPKGVFHSSVYHSVYVRICIHPCKISVYLSCSIHFLADQAPMPTGTKEPQNRKVQSPEPKASEPVSHSIEP